MPLIEVKMIEGVFTTSKKREIITKLTDAMVSIEGENLRPYTLGQPLVVRHRLGPRGLSVNDTQQGAEDRILYRRGPELNGDP